VGVKTLDSPVLLHVATTAKPIGDPGKPTGLFWLGSYWTAVDATHALQRLPESGGTLRPKLEAATVIQPNCASTNPRSTHAFQGRANSDIVVIHRYCRLKHTIDLLTRQYQLAGKETTFHAPWRLAVGLGMDHLTHVRAHRKAHMANLFRSRSRTAGLL